ncbi:MAG: hypothetical protein JWN48_766 [Myxococcaceae bacterium]|nr:hypothetical protein [Myxococcaceae bacterium]
MSGQSEHDAGALADPLDALLRDVARISKPEASWHVQVPIGSTLQGGRLRVLRCLGVGGMGVVFEALDEQRDCRVALKLLTRTSAASVYRIKNEFRALSGIEHRNVVRLYELFAERGHWFFTMELVHGVPFDRWVRPCGELNELRLRDAFEQLAVGIRAVHDAGKLHCDLKSNNVLVTDDGGVVVLDFGLAISDDVGGVGQTLSEHEVRGTPAYMAPEQAAGSTPVPASDLYALGVMLFESLTGTLPFVGRSWEMLIAKQRCEAPRASELGVAVAPDLDALCAALLLRDPTARPTSGELCLRVATSAAPEPGPRARLAPSLARPLLYGRGRELAALDDAFREMLAGKPVLVSISGESGVGKTALCETFLHRVREERSAVVLAGRCFEHESVPFKAIDPIVDALTRYMRSLPDEAATALLPRDAFALLQLFPVLARVAAIANAPARTLPDASTLRGHAIAAFGELLARLRDRGPVIVQIDDLQWTDEDSVALLRQLLVQSAPPPILLIASHRGGALGTPELVRKVVAVAHENESFQVHALELAPLGDDAVRQLVTARLAEAGAPPSDLAGTIVREARGSPFWARELCVAATQHDGSAMQGGERAHFSSFPALLSARLGALAAPGRRLVEVVSLVGRPFPVQWALAAAQADYAELDALCRTHLLRLSPSDARDTLKRVEVVHDRIRETVCLSLSIESRDAAYRELSQVLLQHGSEDDAELLCRALEETGDQSAAAQQAELAAERADRALAFDRAASLFQRAIAVPGHSPAALCALHEKLARALAQAGRGTEAASAFLFAASLCEGEHSLELRGRAAEELMVTGHVKQGHKLLTEVCRESGIVLPGHAAHALASMAWTTARLRLSGLTVKHAAPVSRQDLLRLDLAHTVASAFLGYLPVHAGNMAARYLQLALELGEERHLVWALGYNAIIHSMLSPHGRWTSTLRAHLDEAVARTSVQALTAFADMVGGATAYFEGSFPRARQFLTRALSSMRSTPANSLQRDFTELFDHVSAYASGDYSYLVRVVPERIEEAYRRNRVWLGAMLSGPWSAPAYLTVDKPDALRARLRQGRARLVSTRMRGWPELGLELSEAMCLLYEGQPDAGHRLIEAARSAHDSSMLTRGSSFGRVITASVATHCALAALSNDVAHGVEPRMSPWLIASTRGLAELRRTGPTNSPGRMLALEAGIATHLGEPERALSLLRAAARSYADSGAYMLESVTLRRLGSLEGGDHGRMLLARADAHMAAQGVRNVQALTFCLCPGWP